MIPAQLPTTESQLADFCRKHHIRRLSFFGSVLRNDFRPDSDVDALVEFESGHTPGFGIYDIEQELSQLLGGHPVELVNPKYLNRRLKQTVLNTAILVYEG
ncbi:MAG: nucleotidyltransferase domain-containing protein [Planctomycetaceae bacterium]|nr:nucleotidyltransferase domain-containing protein [Planctomycetaceae bacterium]